MSAAQNTTIMLTSQLTRIIIVDYKAHKRHDQISSKICPEIINFRIKLYSVHAKGYIYSVP